MSPDAGASSRDRLIRSGHSQIVNKDLPSGFQEPPLEISELIPKAGEVRRLYCDNCGSSMELSFRKYSENVSGVQIEISNFPQLRCPDCRNLCLPDRSILMIVELHRQAIAKGSDRVKINRNKKAVDYKFTAVPFLIDADDYYYIPGLFRSFDLGFLTPLFFNRTVLSKFDTLPGYKVRFASQSYGTIDMQESSISFGINRHGKIILWLGDVAKLPDTEQYYLRSENVPSDHAIGSEFYDGQIECNLPIRLLKQLPFQPGQSWRGHSNTSFLWISIISTTSWWRRSLT